MLQPFPLWLEIAAKELGQKEILGRARNNQRIVEYHSVTTLKATEDEVPWCSSYVSWVLEQAGIESTKSAAAMSYASYGARCNPTLGAIAVIRFENQGSGSGAHVGFLWYTDKDKLIILGGNQNNEVNLTSFRRDRLISYRWPTHWANGLPMSNNGRKIL
jgi:uncharacterized protein (TIGR02594 family)